MIKYILRQQITRGNHPCVGYFINRDPKMIVGKITDPESARIVKVDVLDDMTADILMKLTDIKIDAGECKKVV